MVLEGEGSMTRDLTTDDDAKAGNDKAGDNRADLLDNLAVTHED